MNFITTVAWKRPDSTFPVLDLDGRLAGVVNLARLARVPAADRDTVRLGDVLTPRDHVLVLDPASPLADAAPALSAGGFRLAVVAVDGMYRVSSVSATSPVPSTSPRSNPSPTAPGKQECRCWTERLVSLERSGQRAGAVGVICQRCATSVDPPIPARCGTGTR